jgi:hypothetical protein
MKHIQATKEALQIKTIANFFTFSFEIFAHLDLDQDLDF